MKKKQFMVFLILMVIAALNACEAGLTSNDSEGKDEFSFSAIYERLNSQQEEINALTGGMTQLSPIPVGTVIAYSGDPEKIPAGWMECNGQSVTVNDYPALYEALGTRYGGVSGVSFNLPDYRGYFLRGWNHGSGNDPDAAARTNADGSPGDQVGSTQDYDWKTFSTYNMEDKDNTHLHGEYIIPKSGWGAEIFGGRWEDTGSGLQFRWDTTSEIRPKNISVVYLVKS
ncbi:MAG: tail fiber protein [bacterium]|nr:tail fiber protein [bacterium]